MKKLTIPLVALLALAVGLAVGYALGDRAVEPAPAPAAPLPAPDRHEQATAPGPLEPPEQASKPPTLADMIAAAEIPPVPTGSVEYTGTVTTVTGEPIPGVTVRATTDYPERFQWGRLPNEERVQRELKRAKWAEASTRQAVTDAEGRYTLTGLADKVSYSVSAEAEGWQFSRRDPRPPKGTNEHHFVGTATTKVEVRVRLADGSTLKDAMINYRSIATVREHTAYAREGVGGIRLAPGEWTIHATSDGWRDERRRYRSEPVTLVVEEGKAVEPIELVLRSTPSIRGTITLPAGFVRPSLMVRVQGGPPSEPPGRRIESVKNTTSGFVETNDGKTSYEVYDVPPGRHRVLLSASEIVIAWVDVTTTGEDLICDLEVPAPSANDYIIMRVYAPDGSLLPDAEVNLTAHTENINSGRNALTLLAEDGSIWIERYDPDGTAQWYELRVSHAAHGECEVRYEAALREVLEVRLERPAFLTLTVPNWSDLKEKHALWWALVPVTDRSFYSIFRDRGTQTSPIRFGPVKPGKYAIRLCLEVDYYESVDLVSRELELVAGENNVTESVPELYTLKVIAADQERKENIELIGQNLRVEVRFGRKGETKGECTLRFLPAGTYLLKSGLGEMQVTLPGTQEVTFNPRPYDCLRIDFDAGGKVEALGFRGGDKLIEVDGVEIKMNEDYQSLQASLLKTSTTWTVLRAGVRTDVTFDGTALNTILRSDNRENFRINPATRD